MTLHNETWHITDVGRLARTQTPCPTPHRGEVLVRVRAVSLNYRDLLIIDDGYARQDGALAVPLSDGAGEVVQLGEGVSSFEVGDRVVAAFFLEWKSGRYNPLYQQSALGGATPGLASKYVVVPAEALVAIPPTFSFEEGCTFPCAGTTAWKALQGVSGTNAKDAVLIQGTGGVSLFALQLAHARRVKTIVLTSTPEKERLVRSLGADHVINYRDYPRWSESVRLATGGEGVTRVIEVIGDNSLAQSVDSLAPEGEIAYIGCLGGFGEVFNPMQLLYKNASMRGVYVGSRTDLEMVMSDYAHFNLRPIIGQSFHFDELPPAIDCMRAQRHVGKIVLSLS